MDADGLIKAVLEGADPASLVEALDGLKDFEYLLHHIHVDNGKEIIHHCLVFDHKGNMFEQAHLTIKGGKVYLDGKVVKDGNYHVIRGLEPTQEVAWGEPDATSAGVKLKQMKHGMTLKDKAKAW